MGAATGAIAFGSPNVLINMRPASATVLGLASCSMEGGIPQAEATGAATVLINMMPAGRVDEKLAYSAVITAGSFNVMIGGPGVQVLPMKPEVPVWLSGTMTAMMVGGILISTGGIWASYGAGRAMATLAGGTGGSILGALGLRLGAAQLGFGETGQRVAEVVGALAGGGLGARGGFGLSGRGPAPAPRLPQDVNANPRPPRAIPLNRPIGRTPGQNRQVQTDIAAGRAQGGRDFRVNQQQVNAAGQRVGTNRPDLQYTDAQGRRVYIEYDRSSSARGPQHQQRILSNDPDGIVILKTID